jgi:hypothetical protein
MEPVLTASRGLIEWTAEVAGELSESVRPLSPEAERLLAERVSILASAALRSETSRFARAAVGRAVLSAGAGVAVLMIAAGSGAYWFGARSRTITLQVRPGEVAAICRAETMQQAPDGLGRICAVWVRLDQASILGAAGR